MSAILQGVLFFAIAGAVVYGVYRLMKKNGDIDDDATREPRNMARREVRADALEPA